VCMDIYVKHISTTPEEGWVAEIEQVYVTKPIFSSNGGVLAALFHALVFAWCQVL
jgi:hypothetical protein